VVARAVEWAATGELPARLREKTAAALLGADAAAADRRRNRAERNAEVSVRTGRDGMAELVADLPAPVASACREAVDVYARMAKADGDDRPIGQLRSLALADLVLRPWDREPVTAHLTVLAPLGARVTHASDDDTSGPTGRCSTGTPGPAGRRHPSGAGTAGRPRLPGAPAWPRGRRWTSTMGRGGVDGEVGTAVGTAHDRVPARCWTGRRRSTATSPPLRSGGSPVPATAPVAIPVAAAWPAAPTSTTSSLRRRSYRLRQRVLPVPSAPPDQDPRSRLELPDELRRGAGGDHAQRGHPPYPTTGRATERTSGYSPGSTL
jgi:hypothetical protein